MGRPKPKGLTKNIPVRQHLSWSGGFELVALPDLMQEIVGPTPKEFAT